MLAFEAEAQRHPGNAEAWRLLGTVHAENDDDATAIAAMSRALAAAPDHLDVLLALGVSHTNELDQGEALHYLYSWLSKHPSFKQVRGASGAGFRVCFQGFGRLCAGSCLGTTTGTVPYVRSLHLRYMKRGTLARAHPGVMSSTSCVYERGAMRKTPFLTLLPWTTPILDTSAIDHAHHLTLLP